MPMAESNPPMVVGIKQTNKDTNDAIVTAVEVYSANGLSVMQTITKTSVKPAKRIKLGTIVNFSDKLS